MKKVTINDNESNIYEVLDAYKVNNLAQARAIEILLEGGNREEAIFLLNTIAFSVTGVELPQGVYLTNLTTRETTGETTGETTTGTETNKEKIIAEFNTFLSEIREGEDAFSCSGDFDTSYRPADFVTLSMRPWKELPEGEPYWNLVNKLWTSRLDSFIWHEEPSKLEPSLSPKIQLFKDFLKTHRDTFDTYSSLEDFDLASDPYLFISGMPSWSTLKEKEPYWACLDKVWLSDLEILGNQETSKWYI